jgi:hypothetical protein
MTRFLLLCLVFITPVLGFAAGLTPRLAPLHDATIAYDFTAPGRGPIQITVRIAAGGRHLRVTGESLPVELLIDRDLARAYLLLPIASAYGTALIGKQDPENGFLRHAQFLRLDADRVSGLSCTHWRAISRDGEAEACITSSGLILSGYSASQHHGKFEIVARRVSQAPLPPDLFTLPHGFTDAGTLPIPGLN